MGQGINSSEEGRRNERGSEDEGDEGREEGEVDGASFGVKVSGK